MQNPSFVRETRAPHEAPPPNSCDAQIHVYGDKARFPIHAGSTYEPPAAALEDAERLHAALGIQRSVIVQATIYRTDHSLLIDTLKRAPADRYRGVAIIDETVSDAEIRRLHEAGVRGARFNFAKFLGIVPTAQSFRHSLDRIRDYGWVVKIFCRADEILELTELIREVTVPVVLDHMCHLDFARGIAQPAVGAMLELLKHDNWWVMLSNGDRSSATDAPWDDAVPFGRIFYEAAPDRAIWCTDWPKVRYEKPRMPNDAETLELLYRYLPDEAARRKVLVDNPARLFGFGRPVMDERGKTDKHGRER